jgi:hypothetical protein
VYNAAIAIVSRTQKNFIKQVFKNIYESVADWCTLLLALSLRR